MGLMGIFRDGFGAFDSGLGSVKLSLRSCLKSGSLRRLSYLSSSLRQEAYSNARSEMDEFWRSSEIVSSAEIAATWAFCIHSYHLDLPSMSIPSSPQ